MPHAYIQYICDEVVGPGLELIRRVCEPKSRSKPHVTVRYPVDRLEGNDLAIYQNTSIGDIDILLPGGFRAPGIDVGPPRTVFLLCASELLEALSYKPDFPDSVFHVTLYDGGDEDFAHRLLLMLQQFTWQFKINFPSGTGLTRIEIGAPPLPRKTTPPIPDYLQDLFERVTGDKYLEGMFFEFSTEQRLTISEQICSYLHNAVHHYPKTIFRMDLFRTAFLKYTDFSNSVADESEIPTAILLQAKPRITQKKRVKGEPGLVLTPPELAQEIIEYALKFVSPNLEAIDFGDPAIGTGVFYSALRSLCPDRQLSSSIGIEINKARGQATQAKWAHRGLDVRQGDYLHLELLPLRTFLTANPPYVRYQLINPSYRESLRQRASVQIGMQINGQSSLYVYFLLLSHSWLAPQAISAWLIPAEFMETNYGAVVRKYLAEKVELLRIHRFELKKSQFENAMVSSTIVVFRNRIPEPSHVATLSADGSLNEPITTKHIPTAILAKLEKWTINTVDHTPDDATSIKVGDVFKVIRGLATGANNFFILTRKEANELGIPDEALKPILPKARYINSDIIERAPDGYPDIVDQMCLLDCSVDEQEISRRYPDLYRYLMSASEIVRESTLVMSRTPWYKQENRDPAPFLCTYMGRGNAKSEPIRFIWNKSDAVATNTYLMLYPTSMVRNAVEMAPERWFELFSLLKRREIGSLVNHGRVYGGGLHKIEPGELRNLPLNHVPEWLIAALENRLPL